MSTEHKAKSRVLIAKGEVREQRETDCREESAESRKREQRVQGRGAGRVQRAECFYRSTESRAPRSRAERNGRPQRAEQKTKQRAESRELRAESREQRIDSAVWRKRETT